MTCKRKTARVGAGQLFLTCSYCTGGFIDEQLWPDELIFGSRRPYFP
jgi:hypothetical protein